MAEKDPILIDEEKLLLSIEGIPLPVEEAGFNLQAFFIPFKKALNKYVSLNEDDFLALLNSFPTNSQNKEDEFFNLKFEELLKLPVEIGRKDANQVIQKQNSSIVESLERVFDRDILFTNQANFQDMHKMHIFTINTIQPPPYQIPSILLPPVVQPAPGLPVTPSITVDAQFTGGLNTEVLLNSQPFVFLVGNVFHEGAAGGVALNAYFASPARAGSSEDRSEQDRVTLITPEGNSFTLFTASTFDNWIGDFVYKLDNAVPHKLATPGLDVVVKDGHKVFTEHFLYSLSNSAGVNVGNIDIQIVDDVPVATNQSGSVTISEADINSIGSNQTNKALVLTGDLFSAPNLAVNRLGPDGGTVFDISMSGIGETVIATKTTLTVTTPQGNELVVNRLTGGYTYTLSTPFNNTTDPNTTNAQAQDIFTYELLDNDGDSATATLTITITDDKPIANAKLNSANETDYFVNLSEVKSGNLITDDDGFGASQLGADGAFITKINGVADGADLDGLNGIISVGTTYGSIDVYISAKNGHQVGDYVYTLDSAKTVLANDALLQVQDIISYVLTDADTPSTSSSTLTITIDLNQAPSAVDDTGSIDEDTVLNVNALAGVLANDTDPNAGDTKVVSKVNGVANNVGNSFALPSGATIQLNADGSYSYDPRVAFNYLAQGASITDDITYTMHDAEGLSSSATLTITITGVNDAPTANDDSNVTHGNTVINVNSVLDPNALLINDTDPDTGDTLTITKVNNLAANVGNQFALTSGALLTVNADGTYQYDPNGKFAATGGDSFTYTISDGHGGTSTATVNISVIVPPIVFDLNDDGISLISLQNSAVAWQFPCGNYHLTGWVGPDDGILVYDANKDGKITLLSEFSFASDHPEASTDLEGLGLIYDTNHDGYFDVNDELFSEFSIWQDKNSNGVTDEGELFSLFDLGITSLNLESDHLFEMNEGNIIFGKTTYTTDDGQKHIAADVGLLVGEILTYRDVINQTDEIDFTGIAQSAKGDGYVLNQPSSFDEYIQPFVFNQIMQLEEPVVSILA